MWKNFDGNKPNILSAICCVLQVTDASWEELEKEGVGGFHNASAYCLMYIDKSRIEEEPGKTIMGNQTSSR